MSDDFLWECALASDSKIRDIDWIVPSIDDVLHNENESNLILQMENSFQAKFYDSYNQNNFSVRINELKDDGILEVIGGEIWEASLLLSVYLIINHQKYLNYNHILELGSGVGIVSFVVIELSRILRIKKTIEVTDFDSKVLLNIARTMKKQYSIAQRHDCTDEIVANVAHLDWNDFVHPTQSNHQYDSIPIDFVYGSALCYSPYHVCLADTIKYVEYML